jgi:hypothetical protein
VQIYVTSSTYYASWAVRDRNLYGKKYHPRNTRVPLNPFLRRLKLHGSAGPAVHAKLTRDEFPSDWFLLIYVVVVVARVLYFFKYFFFHSFCSPRPRSYWIYESYCVHVAEPHGLSNSQETVNVFNVFVRSGFTNRNTVVPDHPKCSRRSINYVFSRTHVGAAALVLIELEEIPRAYRDGAMRTRTVIRSRGYTCPHAWRLRRHYTYCNCYYDLHVVFTSKTRVRLHR